jgi:hypothetical protein
LFDPGDEGMADLVGMPVVSVLVLEDLPDGMAAEGVYLPDGRLAWDARVLASGGPADRLRTAVRQVAGEVDRLGRVGRPPEDVGPDVARYAAEVDRRLGRESTHLGTVAPLMGWNVRTVRRHVQAAGFRDWRAFVASRRVARDG